jgi:hypothetical protein
MFDTGHLKWKTIYDFADTTLRYSSIIPTALFGAFGLFWMIWVLKTKKTDGPGQLSSSWKGEVFLGALIGVCFSLLMIGLLLNDSDFKKTKLRYKNGDFKITYGSITNFNKKRGEGKRKDNLTISFDIYNVHFSIDNYSVMHYGCTSDDIKNVDLRNGDTLNLWYYPSDAGNIILKLQTLN